MTAYYPPLDPAQIDFEKHAPVSAKYGDVYFSKAGGVAESLHTYLDANNLKTRFANASSFHLGELGFGTGLNFLLTIKYWQDYAPPEAQLHYHAIEKHPMTLDHLRTSHRYFPECDKEAALLQAYYPALIRGKHTMRITPSITLTLYFDDVAAALPCMLPRSIDAWFLDGFAPAKNDAMWSEAMLQHIGICTKAGGSFSTFTSVGEVKRRLQRAGFVVQKSKGYGYKRDMLVGNIPATSDVSPALAPSLSAHRVAVIGGGLAGASAAYAAAQAGMEVTIYERHSSAAQEASGNPAGILYPLLAKHWDAPTLFYATGFQHSINLLKYMRSTGAFEDFALCGMADYGKDEAHIKRLTQLPDSLQLDSELGYWDAERGAFFMPHSGWVNVPAWCKALLHHPQITHQLGCTITQLDYSGKVYTLQSQLQCYEADSVVIANAMDATTLLPQHDLPMRHIYGQISYIPAQHMLHSSQNVLCYGSYLTPEIDGMHYVGATFRKTSTSEVTSADHLTNLSSLRDRFPDMLGSISADALQGRVAARTVSADRLPIIGALYDADYNSHLKSVTYNHTYAAQHKVLLMPRCYISLAHAARGLVSAPLAGQLIAEMIQSEQKGEELPPPPYGADALSPERFVLRKWRRGVL
jgi:tRNA 5-methylaminomethyl-2-thiouridine biosynthesis bifunctional protein